MSPDTVDVCDPGQYDMPAQWVLVLSTLLNIHPGQPGVLGQQCAGHGEPVHSELWVGLLLWCRQLHWHGLGFYTSGNTAEVAYGVVSGSAHAWHTHQDKLVHAKLSLIGG
jgi:hypothetical protein